MLCNIAVDNTQAIMGQNHEHEEHFARYPWNGEEVKGN
jgi:hypothetical protein